MRRHIEILAYLHIVLGALTVLTGLVLALFIAGSGLLAEEENALWVTSLVGGGFGFFMAAMGGISILGGWGLLKRFEWARILIIILSIASIPGFPFGTALGVYGLWVLFSQQSKPEFTPA